MGDTNIQWTSYTWNPITGCHKISPGCKNCYAERLARTRLKRYYPEGFDKVSLHPERLEQPLKLRKPRQIFVNSMSDLFDHSVPDSFILQVMSVIKKTPQHIYQVLTKRPERMQDFMSRLWFDSGVPLLWGDETPYNGMDNLWLGVSVENQDFVHRVDYLRRTPAKVRFLSCEPLLGELKLDLKDIHWVIVGGESGFNHRPMKAEWAQSIRDQCIEAGVPFFFKQWGGRTSKANGRLLEGREWNEKPGVVAKVA